MSDDQTTETVEQAKAELFTVFEQARFWPRETLKAAYNSAADRLIAAVRLGGEHKTDSGAGLIHQVASPLAESEPRPIIHELKTWPNYYAAVIDGSKMFEVREDDRHFRVGDLLRLREWSQRTEEYSGSETYCEITYVLSDYPALQNGYVVLGISQIGSVSVSSPEQTDEKDHGAGLAAVGNDTGTSPTETARARIISEGREVSFDWENNPNSVHMGKSRGDVICLAAAREALLIACEEGALFMHDPEADDRALVSWVRMSRIIQLRNELADGNQATTEVSSAPPASASARKEI